jgi:hypothetical protein
MALTTLGSMAFDAKYLQIALHILSPILKLLDVIRFKRKPWSHSLSTLLAAVPTLV